MHIDAYTYVCVDEHTITTGPMVAQQVKMLATEPEDPGLTPHIHIVDGKN